jgi:hypothetical protein
MRPQYSITGDDLISFKPCYGGSKLKALLALFRTRPYWTWREIAALEQYPPADRLWLLLRPELIAEPTLHTLSCDFAEYTLELERAAGRDPDPRLWAAVATKRRWIAGAASDAELTEALQAAWRAWSIRWPAGARTASMATWNATVATWNATAATWEAAWNAAATRNAAEAAQTATRTAMLAHVVKTLEDGD